MKTDRGRSWNLAGAVVVAAVSLYAALLLVKCSEDERQRSSRCPGLDAGECVTSRSCAMGLVCAGSCSTGTVPPRTCEPPLPEGPHCRLERRTVGQSDVLIRQFNVQSFKLAKEKNPDGTAVFEWSAPPNARIVKCALFGCLPEIVPFTGFDIYKRYAIVNYNKCVLAERAFEPPDGTFDVGDPRNSISGGWPKELMQTWWPGPNRERWITGLYVGCWAFDQARIIGATTLSVLSPGEVYNYGNVIDLDCKTNQLRPCWEPVTRNWGTCHGKCYRRCQTAFDCQAPILPTAHDAGTKPDAGAPVDAALDADMGTRDAAPAKIDFACPDMSHKCERWDTQPVGVCVPLYPDAGTTKKVDSGGRETGTPDRGATDAGATDAGDGG